LIFKRKKKLLLMFLLTADIVSQPPLVRLGAKNNRRKFVLMAHRTKSTSPILPTIDAAQAD
jgi:hypothetical protein